MSFTNPANTIKKRSVVGVENEWIKMWDPPTASPPTRELLDPTNPVPEFCAAVVPGATVTIPHTVPLTLLHGTNLNLWDGNRTQFFTIGNADIPASSAGTFPALTLRIPRGKIFHGETKASGPPPHTIHWHGLEPTPMNDGVGHCSMEIGAYTYQLQPNFIGSYFYHCHRNTVQHFEFGLYGFLIVEPPDAYDQQDPALPNYAGGYPRRTAANLAKFPQFPGYVAGDPVQGVANGDPHAFTVPYDVEALWVIDDVDTQWRAIMGNAKATYPNHPPVDPLTGLPTSIPGVNDNFFKGDFHDFNPDYFFVTGAGFPGPVGTTATCAPNLIVPPDLNSGVTGMQVSVNAKVGQTILVRALCASYVPIKITFPVDVVIIAFDGRALGVPPQNQYNSPFLLKAGTPYDLSTARRFDALIRSDSKVDSFANIEFRHSQGDNFLLHGRIPITIS